MHRLAPPGLRNSGRRLLFGPFAGHLSAAPAAASCSVHFLVVQRAQSFLLVLEFEGRPVLMVNRCRSCTHAILSPTLGGPPSDMASSWQRLGGGPAEPSKTLSL
jgi:hypothetical protein